jgi:hypothetical protein
VLDIDAAVPLTRVDRCPGDEIELRTLCTFIGRDENVIVRVGCCPACGHVSYIDRPTAAWMNDLLPRLLGRRRRRGAIGEKDCEN